MKRHHLQKEHHMSAHSESKTVHSLSPTATPEEANAYWEGYYGISAAQVVKNAHENHEANRRALVARGLGVDPAIARSLGY